MAGLPEAAQVAAKDSIGQANAVAEQLPAGGASLAETAADAFTEAMAIGFTVAGAPRCSPRSRSSCGSRARHAARAAERRGPRPSRSPPGRRVEVAAGTPRPPPAQASECDVEGRWPRSETGAECRARSRTSRQDTPSLTSAGAPITTAVATSTACRMIP